LRQEDHEFEASLGGRVKRCLKKKERKKKQNKKITEGQKKKKRRWEFGTQ
jgi:hypothetical protein